SILRWQRSPIPYHDPHIPNQAAEPVLRCWQCPSPGIVLHQPLASTVWPVPALLPSSCRLSDKQRRTDRKCLYCNKGHERLFQSAVRTVLLPRPLHIEYHPNNFAGTEKDQILAAQKCPSYPY